MLAAQRGHTETVKALIEAGADVNLQNKASSFILFISVYSDSIWFYSQYVVTALMLAALLGHTATVKALIEAGDNVNLQNKASSFILFISVYSGSIVLFH